MKVGNPSVAMVHKIINTLRIFYSITLGPIHTASEEFEIRKFHSENSLLAILDLCLRKTQPGKSHDYCDTIIFKELCFQNMSI